MAPGKKKTEEKEKEKPIHPRLMTPTQRREKLLEARKKLDDDYKVLKTDDNEKLVPYGMLVMDHVLRLQGIGMRGRVSQIHGNEGAGKSTLTYKIARNFQLATGEPLAIFDFERTGTVPYLKAIGVDMSPEMCFFKQPDSVEDCQQDVIRLMQAGTRFFIFDSIPRMKSKIDAKFILDGKAFKASMAVHARVMAQFYDNMLPHVAEYDGHFMMVNQTRDRIDSGAENAQKYPTYTNLPYTLPGGRSCRFTPSVMIENKMMKAFKAGGVDLGGGTKDDFILEPETPENKDIIVATRVRLRALKNKVGGGGYREGYVWMRPDGIGRVPGIDENASIREFARAYGLIDYTGGGKNTKWFVGASPEEAIITYNNKEEAIKDLVVDENPEVLRRLSILVAKAIDSDSSSKYATEVSGQLATYLSGTEDDETDPNVTVNKAFQVEEDI
jgi:RecA/RadA recombinase